MQKFTAMSRMKSVKILLILILMIIFAVDRTYGNLRPCKNSGICVAFLNCTTITELSRRYPTKPLPPPVSSFVRQSFCGISRNIHHFCCDPKSVIGYETTSVQTTTSLPVTTFKSVVGERREIAPVQTIASFPVTTSKYVMAERKETAPIQITTLPPLTTSESVLGQSVEKVSVKTTVSPSITTSTPIRRAGVERSEDYVQAGLDLLQQQTNCGKSDANRVANGENANLSEFPWMALLIYSDGVERTINCGGSLIHERYVLTAAHCIWAGRKQLVSVRLGEHNTESIEDCEGEGEKKKCAPPTQEINIEKVIYNNDFDPSKFSDDIALLRLVTNAVIRSNVKPVCLPITDRSRNNSLSYMMIAGWGHIDNRSKATILQKARVPIKTIEYCQQIHVAIKCSHKQLCAGGENQIDTCKGDSGGPLFYIAPYNFGLRYVHVQYGVATGGNRDCGSNDPSIYVRVDNYLRWIASNLT
ncbi:serine protease grass-like [Episyrphus balteatus]|uniref:serine protease grass-like n=1 Tax=Episyrphus balteatus TaxID=286459 RepID=UPI0024861C63|nr:serine protease grass-like [Episyrphus balteatus]